MNKIITLENGLTIVFYEDNKKHSSIAYFITKFGGINNKIYKNEKLKTLPSGCAHFLEHLLIEKSKYGNIFQYFRDKHVEFNGLTNNQITNFYIDTVHDFPVFLEVLIDFVNNPIFKENDILEVREAIIEEFLENYSNDFYKLHLETNKCLFNKINYGNVLGKKNDIKKISYQDLIDSYLTFYTPSNQILIIGGNVNIEETLSLIKKLYKSNEKENANKYKIPFLKEQNKVLKSETERKTTTTSSYTKITYKINISNLNNREKVNLSFYISFFTSIHFQETSDFYKKLIEKRISVYNIDISINYINDFLLLEFGTYTNKKDQFIKLIQNELKNIKFNKKDFNRYKKQTIIDLLIEEEFLNDILNSYILNIINFSYYDNDKIEDITKLTFENYKEIITNLNFENYVITNLIKK